MSLQAGSYFASFFALARLFSSTRPVRALFTALRKFSTARWLISMGYTISSLNMTSTCCISKGLRDSFFSLSFADKTTSE